MKRTSVVVLLSCSLTIGVAGTAGATTISDKAAAKQYLAIVAPVNAAGNKFVEQVAGWTTAITNAKAETEAKPVIAAALNFDTALGNDSWPPSARSDVKTLRKADASLVADLRALSSDKLHNSSSIVAKFERDEGALGAAAATVRYDLGLPSTSATTSANSAISSNMIGTADPKIPPMVPGKVAILETGRPYSKDGQSTVTVMVGNGTTGTISHLVVAGSAVDSAGKVVSTGESQGFSPWNVAPGQVSFGYVYFDSGVPSGAKLQLSLTTYNNGISPLAVDLKVTQAQSKSDGTDPMPNEVVGSVTNSGTTPVAVSGGEALIFCFDAKGDMTNESVGGIGTAGQSGSGTDLIPGASVKFSGGLYEPPCPTFLVGAWSL